MSVSAAEPEGRGSRKPNENRQDAQVSAPEA